MKHQLTAFEFIAAASGPTLIRLWKEETVVAQFAFTDWFASDLTPFGLFFDSKESLVIEGEGFGHPYWDNEVPSWMASFDSYMEAKRIKAIKDAIKREINRTRISMP